MLRVCNVLSLSCSIYSEIYLWSVHVLKFPTLFSYCSQINVGLIRDNNGTHKMLFRKANRIDPNQTASFEAV